MTQPNRFSPCMNVLNKLLLVGRVGLCQAIAMWREQECSVLWESHCVALTGGRLWDDGEVTCSCMLFYYADSNNPLAILDL